jgi:hypothetical protein
MQSSVLELMDSIESAKHAVGDATTQAREKLPIERLRPKKKAKRSKAFKLLAVVAVLGGLAFVVSKLAGNRQSQQTNDVSQNDRATGIRTGDVLAS